MGKEGVNECGSKEKYKGKSSGISRISAGKKKVREKKKKGKWQKPQGDSKRETGSITEGGRGQHES